MRKFFNLLAAIAVSALILLELYNEMDFNLFQTVWHICVLAFALLCGAIVYLYADVIEEKTRNTEKFNKARRFIYGKKNQIN